VAKLDLKPNENILFPNPYLEDEKNPIIVTTLRVMYAPEGKKQEMDSTKIGFTTKANDGKIMGLIIILVLVGLPFFGIGLYNYYHYKDTPMSKPEPIKGVPEKMYTKAELSTFSSNKQHYVIGIVLGLFGAAFGGAGYLLYKRRFLVVVQGAGKTWNIRVKDGIDQDKLLTMIGASQTSARAMVVQPMPSKVIKPPAGPAAPPKR
jgi:hypothetical protein